MTEDDWAAPFPPESLDVVTLIFVLSAISPKQMEQVVRGQIYIVNIFVLVMTRFPDFDTPAPCKRLTLRDRLTLTSRIP